MYPSHEGFKSRVSRRGSNHRPADTVSSEARLPDIATVFNELIVYSGAGAAGSSAGSSLTRPLYDLNSMDWASLLTLIAWKPL